VHSRAHFLTPGTSSWLAAAVAALIVMVPAPASAAGDTRAVCRAPCAERNVDASCAWLARRPRRCAQRAMRACRQTVRQGLPAVCAPPADLPACLTNHNCPYGSLCVDAICQVVPCEGPPGGVSPCTGLSTCQGDKCVVGDCAGSTESCPAGLHCEPADGVLGSISGTCQSDDPGIVHCTGNVDCITAGVPNLVCARGVCVKRGRRGGRPRRTTTTLTSVTTTTTSGGVTTTTTRSGKGCADRFDCPAATPVCCSGHCVDDPYANMGICSTVFTPACRVCRDDEDCECNAIDGTFCDTCDGTASRSGCVDPCTPDD
jgi:hypothetical protein